MNRKPDIPPDFANAEIERLYYLQAMGISSYYPRFVLPGALPSGACAWLEDAATGTEAPERVVAEQSVAGEAGSAPTPELQLTAGKPPHAGFTETIKATLTSEPESKIPMATSPASRRTSPYRVVQEAAEPVEHLQFQMLLLRADRNLVLCNQIPALAKGTLSRKEAQLLHNILLWLRRPLQQNSTARCFTWPLPGLGHGSRVMAGKSLQSFLEQAQQELGFAQLVLMGSSSIECLEEFQREGVAHKLVWQQFTTHSLAEMLALPALKRSVYEHLLPLQEQLAAEEN